jgi:VWFA-related protein
VVDLTVLQTESGKATGIGEAVQPAARRYFLLLFDLSHATPAELLRARHAAFELVRDRLHPTDLVAVATWSFTRGPRWLLSFTTDRRQIESALATLGVVEVRDARPDPLGLSLFDNPAAVPALLPGSAGAGGGRAQFEEVAREVLEQAAAQEGAAIRQTRQSEFEAFAQGLEALGSSLKSIDARKYVVLLSRGPNAETLLGRGGDSSYESVAAEQVASGAIWNVSSEERFGSSRSLNRLEVLLESLRRANCTIQAVDLTGLAETGFKGGEGRELLHALARDTGGELYENFNDFGEAIGRLLETTSVTYVLTIQPSNLKLDGRYHELKVRLKRNLPGARLVHRPGYFSPLPPEKREAAEQRMNLAALLVAGKPGGTLRGGLAWAALRTPTGEWHIPVVYELAAGLGLPRGAKGKLPLAFYIYLFDAEGQLRDRVAQSLELDLDQLGSRLAKEPFRFVADLKAPPGSYSLRALVVAGVGERTRLEVRQLELPEPGLAEPRLLALLSPGAFQEGIVIRSAASAERTKGLPFPFVRGEEFYLPRGVVRAEKGSGALALVALASGLGSEPVTGVGEWVDGEGRSLGEVVLDLKARQGGELPGVERLELSVPFQNLPPQASGLVVALSSESGRTNRLFLPFAEP